MLAPLALQVAVMLAPEPTDIDPISLAMRPNVMEPPEMMFDWGNRKTQRLNRDEAGLHRPADVRRRPFLPRHQWMGGLRSRPPFRLRCSCGLHPILSSDACCARNESTNHPSDEKQLFK